MGRTSSGFFDEMQGEVDQKIVALQLLGGNVRMEERLDVWINTATQAEDC